MKRILPNLLFFFQKCMRLFSDEAFKSLVLAYTSQAEDIRKKILLNGHSLNPSQINIATKVGVKHPKKIRLLVVPETEFHRNYNPYKNLERAGFPSFQLNQEPGVTIQYGVVLKQGLSVNSVCMSKLFRFVTYFESSLSLMNFYLIYLKSILFFGHHHNPYYIDSRHIAQMYMQSNLELEECPYFKQKVG